MSLLVTCLLFLLSASPNLNCSHLFTLPVNSAHAGRLSRYLSVSTVDHTTLLLTLLSIHFFSRYFYACIFHSQRPNLNFLIIMRTVLTWHVRYLIIAHINFYSPTADKPRCHAYKLTLVNTETRRVLYRPYILQCTITCQGHSF